MKKLNLILVLVLLIMVIGETGIVSGENVNGTLGTGGAWNSTNYEISVGSDSPNDEAFNFIRFIDIEKTVGLKSLIMFDSNGDLLRFPLSPNREDVYQDTNAAITAITSVIFREATNATLYPNNTQTPVCTNERIIGTGQVGYVRLFNGAIPPVEQKNGYFYVQVDSWNLSSYNGTHYVYLDYNRKSLYNVSYKSASGGAGGNPSSGFGHFSSGASHNGDQYTQNIESSAYAVYDLNKPAGLGIFGIVNKTNGVGGTIFYSSRVFVSDINHKTISSEEIVNPNPFYVNTNTSQIYLGILSPTGIWYNSSLLFTGQEIGNVSGTHDITFHVMTLQGTGIYNAQVYFVPDLQVGQRPIDVAQTGYTNASGMVTFYNQSASAAAYVGVTATGYKEYDDTFTFTSDMIKEIRLSPPSVEINLDIRDSSTGYYLENVNVGIKNTTSGTWRNSTQEIGSLYFDSTGANYEYPISINETIIVAADKAGYKPNWKSVTVPSSILYNTYVITLYLINLNATAPSSGNFTAVVAVSDRRSGGVIQGASVAITELGRAGSSSTTGTVTFKNIAAGTYTMTASATGFNPASTEITGTDGETVLKSIALVRTGCSVTEGGTVICGNETSPLASTTGNQSANEKAAGGVSAFLDNIVSIGGLILLGLCFWFGKKIIFS